MTAPTAEARRRLGPSRLRRWFDGALRRHTRAALGPHLAVAPVRVTSSRRIRRSRAARG